MTKLIPFWSTITSIASYKGIIAGTAIFSGIAYLALTRTVSVEVDLQHEMRMALIPELIRDHNKVYEQVKEEKWESNVKGEIVFEVTRQSVIGTGNLFPSPKDIYDWSNNNKQTVTDILQFMSDRYSK